MRVSEALDSTAFPFDEVESFAVLLQPQDWSALQLMGRTVAFPPRSVLMYQDEPAERVITLLKGRVKVSRGSADGQELLLSIRGPGDILGALPLVDHQPSSVSVVALEAVRALAIEARAFRRYMNVNPAVGMVLLEVLSHRLRDDMLKRAQCMALDTIGRVAARLVELAGRYGEQSDQGIVIGLPISQEELAAWAGASHAGVAKALQLLRELGWITTERRRITVRDLPALQRRSA